MMMMITARTPPPIYIASSLLPSFLAALDTDVEAEKQKRPGQDGCDRRQDLPHRETESK